MYERLSVVGLGKLGLCLAACFAEKGFETIGVDTDDKVVSDINNGKSPIVETGLDMLISKHGGGQLRATINHLDAIEKTDVTFVLVATPTDSSGNFSNCQIEAALKSLAIAFKKSKKPYHLFVISSTVMPGSTAGVFIPLIEEYSVRKLYHDFDVCYDPDFVALGKVVKDFLNPDLVVIGETSPKAGERIEAIHKRMCENDPKIFRMSIINAEISKMSLNMYITTKISFANNLAILCEKIPGADVDVITNAIGVDRRISPYYFQGGLSFGGTCFPRDTKAYFAIADKYGIQDGLIRAVDKLNKYQDKHLLELVLREAKNSNARKIGIMGLAFTVNTPVITESPALKLIHGLLNHDFKLVVYDKLAMENVKRVYKERITYAKSGKDCLLQSDLGVITLRSMKLKQVIENFDFRIKYTLIDCWRLVDHNKLNKKVKYVAIGRG